MSCDTRLLDKALTLVPMSKNIFNLKQSKISPGEISVFWNFARRNLRSQLGNMKNVRTVAKEGTMSGEMIETNS